MKNKKRGLLLGASAVAGLAAIASLVAGGTFGLFSTSKTGTPNSFTAGKVTVSTGTGTTVKCTITNLLPGTSSKGASLGSKTQTTCKWSVKYTGSVPADVAVNVAVANGTNALFTSGSNQGIQFYLKAGATTLLTSTATDTYTPGGGGTTYLNSGGSATALPAAGVSNLLIANTAPANTAVTFTLDYLVPLGSTNTYNNTTENSVTVTLTFHAVQSKNNANTCTVGRQCTTTGTFHWS
jgi:predicted ribosomally synthesized peptide with SipW-like signal peptide